MSDTMTQLRPMDARTEDDNDRLQRAGAQSEGGRAVRAPRTDTARAQTMREGDAQARAVRSRLESGRAPAAGGGQAPAVQSIYGRVDMNPNGLYGPGPVERAINVYEGVDAVLANDYDRLPAPERVVEFARANQLPPANVYRSLVLERGTRLKSLADQHDQLVGAHENAVEQLKETAASKRNVVCVGIVLTVVAVVLAVSTAVVAYLLASKGGGNNAGGGVASAVNPALQVNPFLQHGFLGGVPGQADVLYYDAGYDPTTIAIGGADTTGALAVQHEGVWSIDGRHRVLFTPYTTFFGNPTPQSYTVKSIDGSTSGSALVTLIYDGDFLVPSIIQTTFAKGRAATVPFLAGAVGADPKTAALVGADPNSGGLVKIVGGEGTWTLDRTAQTVTFDPGKTGFAGEPGLIQFSVSAVNGTRTAQASIILVDEAPSVSAMTQKAAAGQAFVVIAFVVPGTLLDAASLQFHGPGSAPKSLTVAKEGQWSIDAAGTLGFVPAAGFKALPSPVTLVIADTLGRQAPAFTLTTVPFTPPFALNAFPSLVSTLAQMAGSSVTCAAATTAVKGDFPIDLTSVRILGLLPFDNALPTASYVTQDKEMIVPGEGIWKVDPAGSGTIVFTFDAAPVRWPTPIGYAVKDKQRDESNLAVIWIVPSTMNDVEVALSGVADIDDATFWTRYHDDVLTKQVSLGELVGATFLLQRSAELAVSPSTLMLIDAIPIATSAAVTQAATAWATTYKGVPTTLADATAFIDNAYVDAVAAGAGLNTKVGSTLTLATRIIRLRVIGAVLNLMMN